LLFGRGQAGSSGPLTKEKEERVVVGFGPVLVVEDDPLSRFAIRHCLGNEFEVLEAGTGNEALALLDRTPVGLVVTDLVMPGMDGVSLTRAIRERGDIKVVWCTAYDREEFRRAARELRVDGYLEKPLDLDQLHRMIVTLLGAVQ
jgi:two-component system cell cycle sensor histidine kinase/response regulator CckA